MAGEDVGGTGLPIPVAVVEDIPLFRRLLEDLLDADSRTVVVATAANAQQGRTVIPGSGARVLVLDLNLPDEPGLLLGLELRRSLPDLRVVVLSEYVRPEVLGALDQEELRFWSYVIKGSITSADHLISTIVAAAKRTVVDDRVRPTVSAAEIRLDLLTDRQREIMALVASGLSNPAIAERLHLSRKAVEYHLTQVYAQLGLLDDPERNARVQASVLFATTKPRQG